MKSWWKEEEYMKEAEMIDLDSYFEIGVKEKDEGVTLDSSMSELWRKEFWLKVYKFDIFTLGGWGKKEKRWDGRWGRWIFICFWDNP